LILGSHHCIPSSGRGSISGRWYYHLSQYPVIERPYNNQEEMYRYQPGTAATLLEAGSTVAFSTHDTLHGLKAKGTALMRKVRCLSVSSAYHGENTSYLSFCHRSQYEMTLGPKTLADMPLSFTMDYYIVTNALDQFITSLPPVPSKASSTSITSYGSALAELALPATVCRAGLMQLCWMISGEDEEAHKKMLNLGNEIVDITRMVEKVNEIWWQVPIQVRNHQVIPEYGKWLTIVFRPRWLGVIHARYTSKK
jgi:hypothetical protein